jgi:HAD superfamily hydrolase (TIGR01549 family)
MSGHDEFDWIFFDCFNTLIDDFDEHGEENGLGSLPQLAVTLGYYSTPDAFVETYVRVRREGNSKGDGGETLFNDRLTRVLLAGDATKSADDTTKALAAMLAVWEREYNQLIRPTPGAAEMLAYWSVRKPIGVVSNFFLPHYPQRFLERFGLLSHFRFVLDSAAFGFRKPHPKIFDQALSLAQLSRLDCSRVLFIGDRLDLDVIPASELGMRVIHFNRSLTRKNVNPAPAGVRTLHQWADFR